MTAPRYPGGQWRPLGEQTQGLMRSHDVVCLHTMVGSLAGTDAYFRAAGYGGTESHFGVGHDGTTYQWQDLDYTADANLDGKYRVISIETADYGTGFQDWDTGDASQVPAWTPAQLDRLVDLVGWLCDQYGIPKVLMPDSYPWRRGIGYHRQGVDPYRVIGGERWSLAYGKVCPGARRIAQIPEIVARLNQTEPPVPPDPEDDDMPQFLNVIIPPAPRDEAGAAQTDVNGRPRNATQIALPKGGGTGGVKVGNIWLSVYASVSASSAPIRVWGERSGATDQPEQLWAGDWSKETRLRTRSDTSVELPDPTHGVTIAHDSPESVAVLIEFDRPPA